MIAGQSIFPSVITSFKILITITLDYIILIGHYWEKQGWFAPIMYKLTPKSVQHIPVWMLCIVCSSRPSPVSCWYLPRFNFIFFLAPLISTHTLKRNFKTSWLGEKGNYMYLHLFWRIKRGQVLKLTSSIFNQVMAIRLFVTVTLKISRDEILWCCHLNETSVSCGTLHNNTHFSRC